MAQDESAATKSCPYCGETILVVAKKCRYCGEYLEPELRALAERSDATDRWLLPMGRPASAIAAGYLGLIALFPVIGLVSGLVAIPVSVIALKTLRQNPELIGRGRAIFGLITGILGALYNGLLVVTLLAMS